MLTDGKGFAKDLGYARLPNELVELVPFELLYECAAGGLLS
jgi:hypothetical protein